MTSKSLFWLLPVTLCKYSHVFWGSQIHLFHHSLWHMNPQNYTKYVGETTHNFHSVLKGPWLSPSSKGSKWSVILISSIITLHYQNSLLADALPPVSSQSILYTHTTPAVFIKHTRGLVSLLWFSPNLQCAQKPGSGATTPLLVLIFCSSPT